MSAERGLWVTRLSWFALAVVALFAAGFLWPRDDVRWPTGNAVAAAFVPGSFKRPFTANVIADLPLIASNHAWYTNWLMLEVPTYDFRKNALVQVGIGRERDRTATLTAFVELHRYGGSYDHYVEGAVSEGEHLLTIRRTRSGIALGIDHRVLKTFKWTELFSKADSPTLLIGSEVMGPGDRAAGYFRNIRIRFDDAHSDEIPQPRCLRFDRGVYLRLEHGRYVAFGSYDPATQSGYTGCLP